MTNALNTRYGKRARTSQAHRKSAVCVLGLAAAIALPMVAHAGPRQTASGAWAGGLWTAQSTIVGQTSTAILAGGGDPIYSPQRPEKNGVVQLLIDYGNSGAYVCSGSLASDRRSIITAGHCAVRGEDGRQPKITAFFNKGEDEAPVIGNPFSTAIKVSKITIAPAYTHSVIDQNDVAVLRLADYAPGYATAYDIYNGGDLTGLTFNVAGYGRRSDTGGALGVNLGTGRLKEGDNVYERRFGDPIWNGELDGIFGDESEYDFSYIADFDNGTEENDATCQIAIQLGLDEGALCDRGLGAREATIAGGDSGGPGFVDGKLASVNSYSLSFGPDFGDYDGLLNSSWGEYAGYVPLFLHYNWINGELFAPEPGALALLGLGVGMIALRSRRSSAR